MRRTMVELRSLWSFLQDGPDWFVLSEWDGDPAMVVVYAGSLSRVKSSGVHQRLFEGNHLVQLLQLPLLPRQLVVHDSNTSGRRAQLPPPFVTIFSLFADFAPLLGSPVLASLPAPAAAPAGALASAATPAAALGAPL